MYIDWKFNNEAENISLEEFEKENESFFGFMTLKLGDYQLGHLDKLSPFDEGDEDISYYINSLIKCGITLLLGQDFKIQLLGSNLLEIRVHKYIDVNVKVSDKELLLRIRDDGLPFDPTKYEFEQDDQYLTGGIAIITALADELNYLRVLNLNNTVIKLKLGEQTNGNQN